MNCDLEEEEKQQSWSCTYVIKMTSSDSTLQLVI